MKQTHANQTRFAGSLAHWARALRFAAFASPGFLLGAPVALAGDPPPPGRLLASQCFQCHGTNGNPVSGFEGITGESAGEMFKELVEMKRRPVESIMDRQARGYTDAQLQLIAAYLATLPSNGEGSDE